MAASDPFGKPWLKWFKPRSIAWRTTLLVATVALLLQCLSLQFFWYTFYKPELKHHAVSLAHQIDQYQSFGAIVGDAKLVTDPADFPTVRSKWFAELFTRVIALEIGKVLASDDVVVYFNFKPQPQLWVNSPTQMGVNWLQEDLITYGTYSIELILLWLLGTPILTVLMILVLVRSLNRPLARLQQAAQSYSTLLQAPMLDTSHGAIEIRQVNHAFNQMLAQLEAVDTERKTMLAGISHDVRTPLTRMRLSVELEEMASEVKSDLVASINEIDAILSQFMAFIEHGLDEPLVLCSMAELLADVRQSNRQDAIITNLADDLPPIYLRPIAIKRVLSNLISNAKRYGKPPITISVTAQLQNLVMVVADSAVVPVAERITNLEQLFKPFVRGEAARTTQGTGLGLAIVERIVRAHQGTVSLRYSAAGNFAVLIELPLTLHQLGETV